HPGFIAVRRFFQVLEEQRVAEALAAFGQNPLRHLPDAEKLSRGLEEKVLVQESVVEKCADLLPVGEDHHGESAAFASRRRDAHGFVERGEVVVLEVPVAGLTEPLLTTLLEELQLKLCLLVRRLGCHSSFLPWFVFWFCDATALTLRSNSSC